MTAHSTAIREIAGGHRPPPTAAVVLRADKAQAQDVCCRETSHREPSGVDEVHKKEQNELLTQTGPGTPMGQMFRSYWIPALRAEELPENDCPPVRDKPLSESTVSLPGL